MSWPSQIWQSPHIRLLFSHASTGSGARDFVGFSRTRWTKYTTQFIQTALAKWKPVEVLVFEQTGAAAPSEWGAAVQKHITHDDERI